jgi:hypothetical protein
MFEPVVIYSAEARYQDLLSEAERERQAKRSNWDLLTLLALLHVLAGYWKEKDAMFDPVVIYSAAARYDDLLYEAETERLVKHGRVPGTLVSLAVALGLLSR